MEGPSNSIATGKSAQYVGPFDPKKQLEGIPTAKSDTIWVNTDPVYERWRWDHISPVLWITGPPGCGKSVMARHLVEGELQPEPGAVLCYHFFPSSSTRSGETGEYHSTDSLLDESILYQILQAETTSDFDPSLRGSAYESLLSLLSRTPSDMAGNERVSLTCVLDGLDQVTRNEDEVERVEKLLDRMVHGDHGYIFKLLITCRPTLPTLEAKFPKALFIRLENHIPQFDVCVRRYLNMRIMEPKIDNNLPDGASEQAYGSDALDGSFLVAENFVTTGRIGPFAPGLRAPELPQSLRDRYSSVLDRADDRELLMAFLKTLAVASRALMPEELVHAICLDDEKIKHARYLLRSRCEGLIAHDEDRGLTLVHGFRVLDFVYDLPSHSLNPAIANQVLHREMAELCMDYISSPLSENSGDTVAPDGTVLKPGWPEARPFLGYAAIHWTYHVKFVGPKSQVASWTNKMAAMCCPTSRQFMNWFPIYCRAANPPMPLQPNPAVGLTDLMVASHFNFRRVIEVIWRQTPILSTDGFNKALKADDIIGHTALHIAAVRGNVGATHALISELRQHPLGGAIINKPDWQGRTPLHYAVQNGHKFVTELLINSDSIDINAQDMNWQTPLHHAARHEDNAMVTMLLDANVVVDVQDRSKMTPRMYAKQLGQELEQDGKVHQDTVKRRASLMMIEKMIEKRERTGLSGYPPEQHQMVNRLFEMESYVLKRYTGWISRTFTLHDFLKTEGREWVSKTKDRPRWVHMPANNMSWVELLLRQFEPSQFKIGTRDRILRKEAWANLVHRGPHYHAIFMEPKCQVVPVVDQEELWGAGYTGDRPKEAVSLYMPYIHWEKLNKLVELSNFIERMKKDEISIGEVDNLNSKHKRNELLLYHYLRSPNPLHNRRTLDQYRCSNLEDTRHWDQDQLLCRVNSSSDPPMLMVDQLWLWKLPDGTIITSFPSRWSEGDSESTSHDYPDVLANIKRRLIVDAVETSEDLVRLIVSECLLACFDTKRHSQDNPNVLETYNNEIWRITDTEARLFTDFSQNVKTLVSNIPRQEAVNIVDPMKEIGLLREVKDISDELKTIYDIFRTQSSFIRNSSEIMRRTFLKNERWDEERLGRFDRGWEKLQKFIDTQLVAESEMMAKQANDLVRPLNDLINRKQRFSNVLEARWARTMAEETTRQGTTLMVFTIVTITFLPLSFMAAFFALNIAQFPKTDAGLDLGFVSKYMFSTSAAVVIPLLLIAFNVTRVAQFNEMIKTTILDRTKLTSKTGRPGIEAKEAGFPGTKTKLKGSMTQRLGKLRAAVRDDNNKPGLPLSSLLLYILVIFPITEVRFAGVVLLTIAGKRDPTSTAGAETPHGPGAGPRGRETEEHTTKLMTYKEDPVDEEKEISAIKVEKWRLKPGIRRFLLGIIGGFRICFLPLWLSVLCVEFMVGGVVYGLLSMILVVNPLKAKVDKLRRSTLLSLHDKVE